jgi:hypothetical protein
MTEGLTCRVIDERHTRAQVEIHRLCTARKLPQLSNHVEQVETHNGTIQVQVVGALIQFPVGHRIAEETEEADRKIRLGEIRAVPQGVPEAHVPQVQYQLHDDASADADEQVRRHGHEQCDGEDDELLRPDPCDVEPKRGSTQPVADEDEDGGQDRHRDHVDQVVAEQQERQEEAGVVEIGPLGPPPPRTFAA